MFKNKMILAIAVVALLVVGCSSNSGYEPQPKAPNWFVAETLIARPNEYLGYGLGATQNEAKSVALKQIAYALQSRVKTSESNSILLKNGMTEEAYESLISVVSNVKLSNVMKKKVELLGGQYYVVYSYVNLPLSQKIKAVLSGSSRCTAIRNPYLSQTPLFKELMSELSCLPEISINQRHNQFYLYAEQQSFVLAGEDEMKLFATVKSPKVDLKLSRDFIASGHFYHIKTELVAPGYFSLVQQYSDGTTQLLIDNMQVKAHQAITYPNLDDFNGLEAYNITEKPIQDLTLAMLCKRPIDIAGIPAISSDAEKSGISFFNYLMDISKDCFIASQVQVIQPVKS